MEKIAITTGNAKVLADIFNLPSRKTCPGSTAICREICYAQVPEYMYERTRVSRERNLRLSKKADFVENMIGRLSIIRNLVNFRIHESGDFYSQEYLDKWVEIVKAFPGVTFFAYTKSYMLDFSKLLELPNIHLRYSTDRSTKFFLPGVPLALAEEKAPQHGFTECLGTAKKGGLKCMKDCKICIMTNDNIYFHLHGPKRFKIRKFQAAKAA